MDGSGHYQGRQKKPDTERQMSQVSSPIPHLAEYNAKGEHCPREGRKALKTGWLGKQEWVLGKEHKILPAFSRLENLKVHR